MFVYMRSKSKKKTVLIKIVIYDLLSEIDMHFVIHDTDDYRDLAYFFGVPHAHRVYCAGELQSALGND